MNKTIIIYLDTNIYMDHFDGRVDNLRPLGEFAFQIIRRTFECEFMIIFSSLVLDELVYNGYEEKINELIRDLKEKGKIISTDCNEDDKRKANKIRKEKNTGFNDTVHALIAKRIGADYLVTRNVQDFIELQDLVKIVYPENL